MIISQHPIRRWCCVSWGFVCVVLLAGCGGTAVTPPQPGLVPTSPEPEGVVKAKLEVAAEPEAAKAEPETVAPQMMEGTLGPFGAPEVCTPFASKPLILGRARDVQQRMVNATLLLDESVDLDGDGKDEHVQVYFSNVHVLKINGSPFIVRYETQQPVGILDVIATDNVKHVNIGGSVYAFVEGEIRFAFGSVVRDGDMTAVALAEGDHTILKLSRGDREIFASVPSHVCWPGLTLRRLGEASNPFWLLEVQGRHRSAPPSVVFAVADVDDNFETVGPLVGPDLVRAEGDSLRVVYWRCGQFTEQTWTYRDGRFHTNGAQKGGTRHDQSCEARHLLEGDLDGDGTAERIAFSKELLVINDHVHQVTTLPDWLRHEHFEAGQVSAEIIDLDESDGRQEVIVSYRREYDWIAQAIYAYDNNAIIASRFNVGRLHFSGNGRAHIEMFDCGVYTTWRFRFRNSKLRRTSVSRRGKRDVDACVACPYVYLRSRDGRWEYQGEVLRNLRSAGLEQWQSLALDTQSPTVTVMLAERKPETTYLDAIELTTTAGPVAPDACAAAMPPAFCQKDGRYFVLREGETLELQFSDVAAASGLRANGYYIPHD